jgi:outer membrane PBP1 activator LpoA protein
MQQSTNDSKTNWQLLAIRALLQEGKKQQAIDLFNQLPSNLNSTQAREQSLLAVEVKLAQNDYQGARTLLAKLDPTSLDQPQQARYWQAQIDASQGKPSLTLLRALIAQQPLLSDAKQRQKNIDATWQALTSMPQDQANALVINADENTLQGWLDLQRMWFDNRNDPTLLKAGVKDWQTRYPQNPGAKMLPTALVNMQNYKPASTNKIALFLPLNGQASIFGRTIQQGFEAAKNGAPSVTGSAVPAQVAQAANVSGNDDVVSPSQAEVSDLTATGSRAEPVQAPAQDQAAPAAAYPGAGSVRHAADHRFPGHSAGHRPDRTASARSRQRRQPLCGTENLRHHQPAHQSVACPGSAGWRHFSRRAAAERERR